MRNFPLTCEAFEPRCLLSSIPVLDSYPQASHTIFLDFDGHLVTDTVWNADRPLIHAAPFDIDGRRFDAEGKVTFSSEEVARMVSIWERMAEDFRPFDVNVTTVDPSFADPAVFARGAAAQRVLFTSKVDALNGERWFLGDALGFARVDAWQRADSVVWVFGTDAAGAGEIGSHEMGHALGLYHDGTLLSDGSIHEYRGPHGAGETKWSPIMGRGQGLTQWSRGEYTHANNRQLDVGILASVLGRRPDDYESIQPLPIAVDGSISVEGIIGSAGDQDVFSFEITVPNANLRIEAQPWHNGPNLDIEVALFRNAELLVRDNPAWTLSASVEELQLVPGTYYLSIDGVGKPATEGDPGYSDYGSLGYYRLSGQISHTPLWGDINGDAQLNAEDIDALYALLGVAAISGDEAHSADLNGDRQIDQADVDVLVQQILGTHYGDVDLDRDVDFADFLVLSANFGAGGGWSDGNVTGDEEINFSDYSRLAAAFGFDG